MTIYADILFIINFIMDFFIFWITGKLLEKNSFIKRKLLGAAVTSSIYCAITLISKLSILKNPAGLFITLFVGIYTAFRPKNFHEFSKYVFFGIISSIITGGACLAIGYTFKRIFYGTEGFSTSLLLVSSGLIFVTIKLSKEFINSKIQNPSGYCRAKILIEDKSITLNAFIDTGCHAKDPLTKKPVIICELSAVSKLFPEYVTKAFLLEKNTTQAILSLENTPFSKRVKLIPFSSLGHDSGLLVAIKPDRIFIDGIPKEGLLGVYSGTLCIKEGVRALLGLNFFIKED